MDIILTVMAVALALLPIGVALYVRDRQPSHADD